MSVVTIGLKRKELKIEKKISNQICNLCEGKGVSSHGHISLPVYGLMDLYDDCAKCSGLGKIGLPYRKISRNDQTKEISC